MRLGVFDGTPKDHGDVETQWASESQGKIVRSRKKW